MYIDILNWSSKKITLDILLINILNTNLKVKHYESITQNHYNNCNRVFLDLPPISMVQIENIFSESVLAETLPKPTLVRLLKAKYSDVTYELRIEGPPPSTAPVCSAFELPTGPAPVVFHWLEFHTDSCPTRSVLFLWLELTTNPSKMVGRSESGMRDARGDRK